MVFLRKTILLVAANLLLSIGVVVFMTGYFRSLPRIAAPVVTETSEIKNGNTNTAPFDKVVFMMIDALRSDFVYAKNTGFEFTQSLIRTGAAIPFTARAASPTLTISRIKAITQGTSQSFLDAWLNIANSDNARRMEGEDTWLSRFKVDKHVDKRMVFYGIDVWPILYPEIFDRYESTDSFYVPDFTNVDLNVTRHVPGELQKDDWKLLVLHYLGLDNLAHHGGPLGGLMVPKQAEMDNVVRQIYTAIEHQPHLHNTLFVLAGDHGMTQTGNHGGDTPSEIASAMVFISPRLRSISGGNESPLEASEDFEYYSVINQIDIVPTLAGLLGFSVPANSVGLFVSELLALFEDEQDRLNVLLKNARQMMRLFEARYDVITMDTDSCGNQCNECHNDDSQVVCLWKKMNDVEKQWRSAQDGASEELTSAIHTFCTQAQRRLSIPLSNLSFSRLSVGIACLIMALLVLIWGHSLSTTSWDSGRLLLLAVTASHAATMFNSKLVKEEHHYWYFASLVWLCYCGYKRSKKGGGLAASTWPVALQLFSQCLNPQYAATGFVKTFLFQNPVFLWTLGSITYIYALRSVSNYLGMGPFMSLTATISLCVGGIIFKVGSIGRVNPELFNFAPLWLEDMVKGIDYQYTLRVFWTGLAACSIFILIRFRTSGNVSKGAAMIGIVELVNLYLRSLSRPQNLVLYQIFDVQLRWLLSPETGLKISEIAVTSLLLGQSSFYASGRDNSVASIDLMNGFNGVGETNIVAVFLQTLISNWLGPIWWSLASLRMLLSWLEALETPKSTDIPPTVQNTDNEKRTNRTSHGNETNETIYQSAAFEISTTNGAARSTSGQADAKVSSTKHRRPLWEYLSYQTLYMTASTLAVMMSCVGKRNDPDLWTVLAPKYVNTALWAVFYHVFMVSTLGTGVWSLIV